MGFFSMFRRNRPRELPLWLPCCHVHYQPDRLLISAVHRDITGCVAEGDPARLLPFETDAQTMGDSIVAALSASRAGLLEEESAELVARVMTLCGERSRDSFERTWELIVVSCQESGSRAMIGPTHRYSTGGYVSVKGDPVFECTPSAGEIGTIIRRILDGSPLERIRHLPSHT